jgi:integrase
MAKPPKVIKKEPKTLDRKTIDLLLAESIETPLYIPVFITAQTGMRRGEICALQWKDVDLKAGIIYVKQAMELDREQKIHRMKPVKNEENRRVDITKKLINALTKHKKDQKRQRILTGGDCELNDHVCTMENGKHVTLDYVTKAFIRLAKKCHIDITFHGLRHTHATILANMGIPVKAIAERLGNDPVVTMGTYSHVTPSIQREIVQKLEQYFE